MAEVVQKCFQVKLASPSSWKQIQFKQEINEIVYSSINFLLRAISFDLGRDIFAISKCFMSMPWALFIFACIQNGPAALCSASERSHRSTCLHAKVKSCLLFFPGGIFRHYILSFLVVFSTAFRNRLRKSFVVDDIYPASGPTLAIGLCTHV